MYDRGFRNRSYTFYTQFCFLDELEPRLRQLIEKHGSAFDDYWYYYRSSSKGRPAVARRPLWQEQEERFGVTWKSAVKV
jgi:hypothetical protein